MIVNQTITVQVPPDDNKPNDADLRQADWTTIGVIATAVLSSLTLWYLRKESRYRNEQRVEQQAAQARQVHLVWSIGSMQPPHLDTATGSIRQGTISRISWRVTNPTGMPLQSVRVRISSLVEPDRKPLEWVREDLPANEEGYWDPAHVLPPRYAYSPKKMFNVEFDFRDADGLWWKRDGLKPPVRYIPEPWHLRLWDKMLSRVGLRRI